jgi:hypothetical protein
MQVGLNEIVGRGPARTSRPSLSLLSMLSALKANPWDPDQLLSLMDSSRSSYSAKGEHLILDLGCGS